MVIEFRPESPAQPPVKSKKPARLINISLQGGIVCQGFALREPGTNTGPVATANSANSAKGRPGDLHAEAGSATPPYIS
jgi:hypothetical protein